MALASPVAIEEAGLVQAAGRWLAAPIAATRNHPHADLSAMDGYALRFADLGSPLRVIGESAAGHGFSRGIVPGEAVRIFTGAPVPEGADTILVQEDAARDGDVLRLSGEGPAAPGAHIRPRAQDFAAGDALMPAGARVTAAVIGLAAVAGLATLSVRRPIRVALIANGDELVAPGAQQRPSDLPSANSPMLAALLASLPVQVEDLGVVRDKEALLRDTFAAVRADIVVTTGGASVGDHDLVRPALLAAGGSIDFWRIAMRPGKPLLAGRLHDAIVLGLPGNPVSAYVTARLYLIPLIAHLAGAADPFPRLFTAPLAEPLPANGPREDYIRGRLDDDGLRSWPVQDSGMLQMLARSDVLIRRPIGARAAVAGDSAEFLPLA